MQIFQEPKLQIDSAAAKAAKAIINILNWPEEQRVYQLSSKGSELGMAPSPSPDSPDSDLVRFFADSDSDSDSTSGLESRGVKNIHLYSLNFDLKSEVLRHVMTFP